MPVGPSFPVGSGSTVGSEYPVPESSAGGPFFGAGPEWQRWFRLHQGSRRPWRRSLSVGLGVAAVISVLGVLFGLLWAWLAPGVPVVDAGTSGTLVTDPSPEQYIAADGWFTLLGLGFGLIVTIGSWLLLRRDRGPFLLLGVVGGTLLAGRWVAPMAGEYLGRDAYDQWRATAVQGSTYLAPPELQALGPKLVPAFVAAIVLTLLAGWSNDPDLDLPGAFPGYGANHPAYEDPSERETTIPDQQRYGGPVTFGPESAEPAGFRDGPGMPINSPDARGLPDSPKPDDR
ncbi:hypothetical protein SAMN04489716_5040 [Actinoplanes derwentensis]|uniref:DUF2567 domain-containing protein n=1 Tax=Actinoplanes derwentensis TaxID=113562 RepID=A0A1H2BZB3_9ACTN|nr:hypothetical protein SAMN04489716_5040 [Actinoplanes derwentensis]